MVKKIETGIEGLYGVEVDVFRDARGYFFESYTEKKFNDVGLNYHFIQDNQSLSRYGTIRGLHFQKGEYAQAKLVRALAGRVLDVAVDLRKGSPTFGKHFSMELTDENNLQLMIPRGFAHGFSVLSEEAIFCYKCDNIYSKESEGGLAYNDPALAIDWKIPPEKALLSEKDTKQPLLKELVL
jgi:dTDP-4-dehydrorhamnose 3,5-epimerase